MNHKYYLSINTTSLAHYIQKAIVLPSRFYNNRPIDIQNKFEDYLFLSKIPFINESDCSIELVLTPEEINSLKQINDDIFLLNKPLPISRIKHIYFINNEKRLLTSGKINDGVGFINANIVEILENSNETTLKIEIPKIENFMYSNEFELKIKDFDQKLGGLAFFRFNTENKYNPNYFKTLSFFNSYIKEEYKKNSSQTKSISYEGFFDKSGKWKNLAAKIYKPILENHVFIAAKNENISILQNEVTGMLDYEKINSTSDTYKLAILCTYGSSSTTRKSIDDLISSFITNPIQKKIQEPISLIFGINNGYSVFYNKYKDKTVKFRMDSILDYYVIESIFQYVINDNHNCDKFVYLNNIIDKKPLIDDLYFETFTILDETVVTDNNTIISDIEDNVNSGVLGKSLFDKIKIFIENLLKKKVEENKRLEFELQEEQTKRENQQKKVKEFENQIEVLNKAMQEEKIKYKDIDERLKTLNDEIVAKQKKNDELESRLEKARVVFKEKQSKINNVEGQTKETSQENKTPLKSMRKHELLEFAKQKGIKVNSHDTISQLIDKINTSHNLLK